MEVPSSYGHHLFQIYKEVLQTWPVPMFLFHCVTAAQSIWANTYSMGHGLVTLLCCLCCVGIYKAAKRSSRTRVRGGACLISFFLQACSTSAFGRSPSGFTLLSCCAPPWQVRIYFVLFGFLQMIFYLNCGCKACSQQYTTSTLFYDIKHKPEAGRMWYVTYKGIPCVRACAGAC